MNKLKDSAKSLIVIIFSNMLFAFAVATFIRPHGIIMGGTTGMSLSFEHYLGFDLSITLTIINVLMFLLGFLFLGKKFAMTTILSTFLYPMFLSIFLAVPGLGNITDDLLVASICGAGLLGIGLGFLLRMGASSGGTDIPPLILNKLFHIPVAVTLYAIDTTVLLTQVPFSTTEQMIHGILFTVLTSIVVNKVILAGSQRSQLFIISKDYEKIKEVLLHEMNVGVSMIHMETAMTGTPQQALMCVTTNRKVFAVNQAVQKIDPSAFITISSIKEVHGRGFTLSRNNDEL